MAAKNFYSTNDFMGFCAPTRPHIAKVHFEYNPLFFFVTVHIHMRILFLLLLNVQFKILRTIIVPLIFDLIFVQLSTNYFKYECNTHCI